MVPLRSERQTSDPRGFWIARSSWEHLSANPSFLLHLNDSRRPVANKQMCHGQVFSFFKYRRRSLWLAVLRSPPPRGRGRRGRQRAGSTPARVVYPRGKQITLPIWRLVKSKQKAKDQLQSMRFPGKSDRMSLSRCLGSHNN